MKKTLSDTASHLPDLYKIAMLIVSIALILLMFPHQRQSVKYDYSLGGFWNSNDLYATFDFAVLQDAATHEKELAEAKSKCTLYFEEDSSAYYQALQLLNKAGSDFSLSAQQQRKMRKTIDSIYRKGYIELPAEMPDIEKHSIVLMKGNVGSEHKASEYISALDLNDSILVDHILVPSIIYDKRRTQLELDSRLSQIGRGTDVVPTGSLIIAKGEYITAEKVNVLKSLEAENTQRFLEHYNPTGKYIGQALLCLIAFIALYMFMKNTNHPILEDNKKVMLVFTTILMASAATAFVLHANPDRVLIVPLCIVPILMRIFFDMRVALYIHLTTVIILGNMVPNSYEFIFYQLITGMMSIISVKDFGNRSKFFVVCIVIFFSYSLIYTAGILSQDTNLQTLNPERYATFFVNALLTLLAHPLIYLFERIFGITTDLTLQEIASTNTPALRELSRKAPGTFQHSMQVANISEDLISEIGGNALLAKVGGLYHDIGKIVAPLNFTENQNSGFNPHDELPYEESAQLITQHVRDGITLAHKYHLPSIVTDFIRTHHGTTYTGYFYTKYKAEHPDKRIDEEIFRYPGPRPYSRETAVVMITDSVEAACKSLKNADKEHINKLVDNIVEDKIRLGQLSNCDLTFDDITKIEKMLKNKMQSIYHARISYPVTNTPNQQ